MKKFIRLAFIGLLFAIPFVIFFAAFSWAVRSGRVVAMRNLSEEVSPLLPSVERSREGVLRIGCYNIAHARGGVLGADNASHADAAGVEAQLTDIATLVLAQDLDVIVFNEIDFDAYWSHGFDQAALLQDKTGFPHLAIQHNIDIPVPGRTLRFGNAVLSRHPISELRPISLPAMAVWESVLAGNHDAIACRVEVPGMGAVDLLGVHLEVRSEDTRVAAAEVIAGEAAASALPFLVLGDFNSSPAGYPMHNTAVDGRSAMDFLAAESALQIATSVQGQSGDLSFPSANPDRAIDWVLGDPGWDFSSKKVIASPLSDHCLVVVEMKRK